jgi:hypothetical protein
MHAFPVGKGCSMKSFPIFRALGALLASASGVPYALADDINQASSQDQATNQNHDGAKGTMDEATNRATIALMDLGELNIPGALSNGYKAYGHYLNHNQLKDLESATNANAGTMNSMAGGMVSGASGSSVAGGESASAITGSPGQDFRDLGHASLYEGPAAAALSQFEQKTGLKREVLVQNIGQLVDEIARTDMPLEEQGMLIEHHYDRFAASMPNREFGGHLATVKAMLPLSLRLSFLSHLLGQRDESALLARAAPKPTPMTSLVAAVVPAAAAPAIAAPAPAGDAAAAPAPTVAAVSDDTPVRDPANTPAMIVGVQSDPSINLTDDDATLFTRVKVRYRSLTPMMERPAAVAAN